MNIIGLYSPSSGHGKDTVAKLLQNITLPIPEDYRLTWYEILKGERSDILNYSPWEVRKFATSPKKMVADMYNVPISKLEDREWRVQVYPPFTLSPLHLVIEIAQTMKKIEYDSIWKDILFNQYEENMKWIISDVRFPYEYEEIKKRGGIVVKIERPDCPAPKQALDGLLDDYEFDETIVNEYGKWKQMIADLYRLANKYNLRMD